MISSSRIATPRLHFRQCQLSLAANVSPLLVDDMFCWQGPAWRQLLDWCVEQGVPRAAEAAAGVQSSSHQHAQQRTASADTVLYELQQSAGT
jgi:hypothetical protein